MISIRGKWNGGSKYAVLENRPGIGVAERLNIKIVEAEEKHEEFPGAPFADQHCMMYHGLLLLHFG